MLLLLTSYLNFEKIQKSKFVNILIFDKISR